MMKYFLIFACLLPISSFGFGSFTETKTDRIKSNTEPQVTFESVLKLDYTSVAPATAVYLDVNQSVVSSNTTSTELGYLSGVTSPIQSQLDGKLEAPVDLTTEVIGLLPVGNGGTNSGTPLANNAVMISETGSIVESGVVSVTELNYLDGSTSNIQNQIDAITAGGFVDLASDQSIAGIKNFVGQIKMTSTANGLVFPAMTEAERDAITTPEAGEQVFNTTTERPSFYTGAAWIDVASTGGGGGSGVNKFISDLVFNGTDLLKDTDVSSTVTDARNAIIQLRDNGNDFEIMGVKILATSASNVRIETTIPLPAGSYRLIVLEAP